MSWNSKQSYFGYSHKSPFKSATCICQCVTSHALENTGDQELTSYWLSFSMSLSLGQRSAKTVFKWRNCCIASPRGTAAIILKVELGWRRWCSQGGTTGCCRRYTSTWASLRRQMGACTQPATITGLLFMLLPARYRTCLVSPKTSTKSNIFWLDSLNARRMPCSTPMSCYSTR